MRFILRMAFWLGVVLMLLPGGSPEQTPKSDMSAVDAMSAARATVSDLGQFCERQPQACVVGSQTAVAIGHRIQAGAKVLYEFLNEQLGPNDTGSVSSQAAAAKPSQNTLTPADLEPGWRGPQPRDARQPT